MNSVVAIIYIAVIVFLIASMWKVFVKAGQPGWAAIIPIYGTLIQLRIIGRPWWWLLLSLIPLVNIVFLVIISLDLAKSFGKGGGFGVGLFFLPFIFYPILGFGSATYVGPRGEGSVGANDPTPAW
jgi:hypothetical protein